MLEWILAIFLVYLEGYPQVISEVSKRRIFNTDFIQNLYGQVEILIRGYIMGLETYDIGAGV
jgi:hypothetical protein